MTPPDLEGATPWIVYVLVAESGARTYVGVTTDLERRLEQHNGERPGGARATRGGRPWRVGASYGPFASRGEAQRVERAIKRLRGPARLQVDASRVAELSRSVRGDG
ncbi:MAG: GIY-YIG nuclease family protein [Nannocystaceae bacterium]